MPEITIAAERADAPDATALVEELDDHLGALYPSESRHGLSIARLLAENVAFFVTRVDNAPAGCGGLKIYPEGYAELKRMYVRPAFRGLGLARLMLAALEAHARAEGVAIVRLETGIHQHEAIRLYERAGYAAIRPFGPYRPDPLSRFYEKSLA